jgi:PIN domain nuclease of toxin-antitoxin system
VTYLVDTNAWILFFEDSPELSNEAALIIESGDHDLFVSVASVWEAAIKIGRRNLKLPYDLRDDLPGLFEQNGLTLLGISMSDAVAVKDLKKIHGDPFDRMMAVQADARMMRVISRDPVFDRYGLKRIW